MTEDHVDSTAPLPIEVLPTPNPDAAMFRVKEAIIPGGTFEFNDPSAAERSPLAMALFALGNISAVMITRSSITVTRSQELPWPELIQQVKKTIRDFLDSGELAVDDTLMPTAKAPTTEVEARILQVIEEAIRPAIAQDGGDVEYMGFEDGIVELRLQGSCGSCPHATATLAFGIQRYLMEQIPEVKGVRRAW